MKLLSFSFRKNSQEGPNEDEEVSRSLTKIEEGGGKKAMSSKRINCYDAWMTTSWDSIDQLTRLFRFTQYLDVVISIASLAVTLWLAGNNDAAQVQLPIISIAVACVSLFLPYLGMIASFKMNKTWILVVIGYTVVVKLGFSAFQLVYLYRGVGRLWEENFGPEVVMCVIRIVLGCVIVIVGYVCYNKVKTLKENRKDVMMIGLDGSGKSLLLDTLLRHPFDRRGKAQWEIQPTAGLKMHEFIKFETLWRVYDMSGNGNARSLWPHYYGSMDAIIFVVDARDLKRLENSKKEFLKMIEHGDVRRNGPVILLLLNKTDKVNEESEHRIDTAQIGNLFYVDKFLSKFKIKVQSSSGLNGTGIEEGFQWILDETLTSANTSL